jgi:hypothetical protein
MFEEGLSMVRMGRARGAASRLFVALTLGLLLVSLAGSSVFGASASATGLSESAPIAKVAIGPHLIPASSCHGTDACTGATGSIGENSCNAVQACQDATGNIGHGSCNNYHTCFQAAHNVGNQSCNGYAGCQGIAGDVGNGSCNDVQSCYFLVGSVGSHSCGQYYGCNNVTASIGNFACNGENACDGASTKVLDCAGNRPGYFPKVCGSTFSRLSSSADPSVYRQSITLRATIVARHRLAGIPAGGFQFRIDGVAVAIPAHIDEHGHATLTVDNLTAGAHWISGKYLGDGDFTSSTPPHLLQQVGRAATSTTLGIGPHSPSAGQPFRLVASVKSVAPSVGTPTGKVQFVIDGVDVGSPRALDKGTAAMNVPDGLGAGSHTFRARYFGAVNYLAGHSSSLTQVFNP